MYTHIDTDCPGEPRPQPNVFKPKTFGLATARSINATSGAPFERLPSMNYSILNETKLRKKLLDLGIPSWGPRLLLEKRHREWVMIWNSNCDSSRPKTKREMLQDLDTWERTQGGLASTQSLSANRNAQIKDKDFDGAGWSAEHHDSFNDLIARARKSHRKVGETSQDADSSSGGAKGTEQQHVHDSDYEHLRDDTEVKSGLPPSIHSFRSSEIIDLVSPATEVDTSTMAGDTDMA